MPSKSTATTAQQYARHPFQLPVDHLAFHLGTDLDTGLPVQQINENRRRYGENKLLGQGGVKWYTVLSKQVANAMILVNIP
jgi:P-type Na+/K+ transporter